ncbi:DNA-binding transcriptional regulator, MurR/RpiR family, contains HTH and SIS domains [Arthrobacter alpinus]|uniref:DNA-binding transcriptional regulator, MurR/RpiR family, contains HTH and SIS domains n=1 Tax=Arthrobacter alpinus TaxID=656366 RepID=A0A1H5EZA5_9MICC|nr:MurR/RpiR family transcriptional regulator [Arthrobacter alpinus]SED96278.1 DNA-binding transcriptional regulator, MurR/RpiR family, contains HTH and SIS domains [Arthrobacter alpinus]
MTEHAPGQVVAHIRSSRPSLLPAEQAVAAVFLEHTQQIVELSSQQVAELAGASRATVVRTCQSLGYSGYQQLRVLLARDAGYASSDQRPRVVGAAGTVADAFVQVGNAVTSMAALLDPAAVTGSVQAIAAAGGMLVVGNGLSAPLASDMAARLSAIGRPAESPLDVIGQQIAARLLAPSDLLLIISGSGANSSTLRVAQAAKDAGATLVVITAFARSPWPPWQIFPWLWAWGISVFAKRSLSRAESRKPSSWRDSSRHSPRNWVRRPYPPRHWRWKSSAEILMNSTRAGGRMSS